MGQMRVLLWGLLVVGCGNGPGAFPTAESVREAGSSGGAMAAAGSGSGRAQDAGTGGVAGSGGAPQPDASGSPDAAQPDAAPEAGTGGATAWDAAPEAGSGGTTDAGTGGQLGSGGIHVDPLAPFTLDGCPDWRAYRIPAGACMNAFVFMTTTPDACDSPGVGKYCVTYGPQDTEQIVLVGQPEPGAWPTVKRGLGTKCAEAVDCPAACATAGAPWTAENCQP